VVCHAHRLGDREQDTFVGGSALLLDLAQASSFFPAVYNEDWLFLYDHLRSGGVACAGRTAQLAYDPFASPQRAASEEFGDLIAETLLSSLHAGADAPASDRRFWQTGIRRRSLFLEGLSGRLLTAGSGRVATGPPLAAVAAARRRLDEIGPGDCQSFVDAWRADLATWSDRLLDLPRFASQRLALDHLDLPIVSLEVTR
jgi:hypothetical protein